MAQGQARTQVQMLRSQVVKNSLVIRGPRQQVDGMLQGLSAHLGHAPRIQAETLLGSERSVQLHLSEEDWARVPALSRI